MVRIFIIVMLSLTSAVASEPARTVYYGRSYGIGQYSLPTFDKGYLLFINPYNDVEVYGPDGRLVFETKLTDPPVASIMSVAVDTDGTVAVGVAYLHAIGFAGGIVFLDRSGKQLRFLETERYMPSHVCFDANHILWTFGWQRDARDNGREDSKDYLMFRKFSLDGKELGAYIRRWLFPWPGLSPGGSRLGLWTLRAVGDRIGALANSGQDSVIRELIELDLDGTLIGHWKLGRDAHGGMAFTATHGLCRQNTSEIECFDPNSQAWKKLSNVSAVGEDGHALGILLGADGDNLVFGDGHGNIRATWVNISQ